MFPLPLLVFHYPARLTGEEKEEGTAESAADQSPPCQASVGGGAGNQDC